MTSKELKEELEQKQTGEYVPSDDEKQLLNIKQQPLMPGPEFAMYNTMQQGPTMRNENISSLAAEAGWGESRFDRGEFVPEEDLENKRAIEQTGFNKIVNGAVKGGIYAATTAVETVAGIVDGLLEGTYELGRQIDQGESLSLSRAVGKGVNNFTARTMANIQRKADEWFPNYRTTEERSDKYQKEWYKHILTPNFIGDSFLKNFGFTVGAMAGGAVWAKAINAGLKAAMAGKLMKGVLASAEGNTVAEQSLANALKLIDAGSIGVADESAIMSNISNASKALNKMATGQQLIGGVLSAFGEGTMEGVMARNEFMEGQLPEIDKNYLAEYNNLEKTLIERLKGTDAVTAVPVGRDADGKVIFDYQLNDDGKKELLEQQINLAQTYRDRRALAEELGDRVAATTLAWNIPVLTVSNTLQFGRMLSGGFKTTRNTASKIAGQTLIRDGGLAADYVGTGSVLGKAVGKSLRNGASEASEEMIQGFISSGAKRVADNRLTSFNDDGFDRRSMLSVANWVNGMLEGGMDYLKDGRNWQEGFLGMLTGLIGIPGKQWNGGIPEAVREARQEVADSQRSADVLNKRINSKEFQDAWKGYIRHQKYETEMGDALEADDQYSWKTANDKQLINDIIMFADAGRLQDLKDIVDSYASITPEKDLGVVDEATGEMTQNDATNNPEMIVQRVKEQAEEIKQTIDLYNDMYNAMTTIAPVGTSEDQIKEMIATSMNIKAFEKRFLTMFDEVIKSIDGFVKPLSMIRPDGTEAQAEERLRNAEQIYKALAQLYTREGFPADTKIVDALNAIDAVTKLEDMINEFGDDELKQKVEDMKKVSADRKAFYKKLTTLRDLPVGKFEEEAESPETVIDEQKQEQARKDVEGLNTLEDIKRAYFSKDAKGRAEFLSSLEAIEQENPQAKTFMGIKRRFDAFQAFVQNNPVTSPDITVTPTMTQSMINDIIRRAKTEDELINLPDNVFAPQEQFNIEHQSPFGPVSPTAYASTKQAIRAAMTAYMQGESATSSRETVSSTPKEAEQTGPVSSPDGYDAAAPASMEPAPQQEEHSEPEPEPEKEPVAPINATAPTENQLVDDAADASKETISDTVVEEKAHISGEKDKTAYYRTSVPEIDSGEASKAREAIAVGGNREALKTVDLSDFVVKHPEYADIWNALKDRGAFDFVSTELNVGDEIEFVIDPTFPTYNGKYQILMTTMRNGERQVLTILSSQVGQYFGLSDLQSEIGQAYDSFKESHPNDLFVFDKKSIVWAKRAGLIDYDYSGKEEKAITEIPAYDESAPIVFINRAGKAIAVRGDRNSVDNVSENFNNPIYNLGETGDRTNKVGRLYYLAKSGNGKYIPIRLGVEHYNNNTKGLDNAVFNKINSYIDSIAGIVASSNNTNLKEQNEKLHSELEKLNSYLDMNGIFFEIGEYENVGVALRISDGENSVLRRPDQITDEWLKATIAGYNRSVQIKTELNPETKLEQVKNLNEYVESGVITSNARMLRAKGVDFYTNPYNPESGKFEPVTPGIREAERELVKTDVVTSTATVEQIEVPDDELEDRDNDFPVEIPEVPSAKEEDINRAQEEEKQALTGSQETDPVIELVSRPFAELPSNVRQLLTSKGWSEEEYNAAEPAVKEKALRCAGA